MKAPAQPPALKVMTGADVDAYLEKISTGKATFEGLEATVFRQLQEAHNKAQALSKAVSEGRKQLQAMEMELVSVKGESHGYAQLLVAAEDDRRAFAKSEHDKLVALGHQALATPAPTLTVVPPAEGHREVIG